MLLACHHNVVQAFPLYRADQPQRGETGRPARTGADQVQPDNQSENSESSRPDRPAPSLLARADEVIE